jgi:SHS family lactate transporter-like MFS transporter
LSTVHTPRTDVRIGRRNHSAHFEKAKTAFEEGAGKDEFIEEYNARDTDVDGKVSPGSGSVVDEKRSIDRNNNV